MKDASKPFPTGNPLAVLRWCFLSDEERKAPLLINCWPAEYGDESQVNIEYVLGANKELQDVVISIPVGSGNQHTVAQCDGEFVYSPRSQSVQWPNP